MGTVGGRVYTIADFRKLPEVRPSLEFFGGRVIQKLASGLVHSIIQREMALALHTFETTTRAGRAFIELRCNFGGDSHVFDVSFFVWDRRPDPTSPADRDEIRTPPDLAVEILSPGQTVGELSRKLRSAIRRGVRLGWLIDEKRREVHVLRPGKKAQVQRMGDLLSDEDVLPGFALPLAELFGRVDED